MPIKRLLLPIGAFKVPITCLKLPIGHLLLPIGAFKVPIGCTSRGTSSWLLVRHTAHAQAFLLLWLL